MLPSLGLGSAAVAAWRFVGAATPALGGQCAAGAAAVCALDALAELPANVHTSGAVCWLAVSARQTLLSVEERGSCGRNVVQVWAVGAAAAQPPPRMALAIVHDGDDAAVDLAWCPQVVPEACGGAPTATAATFAHASGRRAAVRSPARLGLLAAIFADGALRLYDVPHPGTAGPAAPGATAPPPLTLHLAPVGACSQTGRKPQSLRWCPHAAGTLYVGCSDSSVLVFDAAALARGGGAAAAAHSASPPSLLELGFAVPADAPRLRGVIRLAPCALLQAPHVLAAGDGVAAAVRAVAVSPHSPRIVATQHANGMLRVWDTLTPAHPVREFATPARHGAGGLDFSPLSELEILAAGDAGGLIQANLASGACRILVSPPGTGGKGVGVAPTAFWDVRCLAVPALAPTATAAAATSPRPPAGAGVAAAAFIVAAGDGGCAICPLQALADGASGVAAALRQQPVSGQAGSAAAVAGGEPAAADVRPLGLSLAAAATPRAAVHRARLIDVGASAGRRGLALAAAGSSDGTVRLRFVDVGAELQQAAAR